jgi:hypothetical protein
MKGAEAMSNGLDRAMRKTMLRIYLILTFALLVGVLLLTMGMCAKAAECGPTASATWGAAPSFTQATRNGCWGGGDVRRTAKQAGRSDSRTHARRSHRAAGRRVQQQATLAVVATRPAFVSPRSLGGFDPGKTQSPGVLSIWLSRCLDEVEARDKEGSTDVHPDARPSEVRATTNAGAGTGARGQR